MVAHAQDPPDSIFDPRVRGATAAILLIMALSAFEGLSVAAALPQVASDLGQVWLLPWVITAYLLTSGVATVAAGALVDRLGVSPVFRVSVTLFVVGGVLAGLAPSMPLLVLARILQGIGAGAVNAVGLTAVGLVYPRALVPRAFAANTTVWGAMSVAGPALAALLLTVASWRWIFLVNLPLGALALAVGWNALPTREQPVEAGRLPGVELLAVAAATFFLLVSIDSLDWRSIPSGITALLLTGWLLNRNRGRADALLAPRHLTSTPLGPLGAGVALLMVGCIGVQTFVPLFTSGARGAGIAATAWSILPFVFGWTTGANVASRITHRIRPVILMSASSLWVGGALTTVGLVAWFEGPFAPALLSLFAAGLGAGASTNSALSLIREISDDTELGRASAAHQFVRNLGFAIGNALAGAVLLWVVGSITGDIEQIRSVVGEGVDGPVDPVVAAAIGKGFALAAVLCGAIAAGSLVPFTMVRMYLDRTAPTA